MIGVQLDQHRRQTNADGQLSITALYRASRSKNKPTVWVKKIPPTVFWIFFPNGWEFLINFYTSIIRSFLH